MQKIPLVTITCARDLYLLELQAQSIYLHLTAPHDVYIVVNESNTTAWFEYFDQNIRHYYAQHNLTIICRDEFDVQWSMWVNGRVNNWSSGWVTQQILKLIVANKIPQHAYLMLDSQNFLIKKFDTILEDKVPYRSGIFSMPKTTWDGYAKLFGITSLEPNDDFMSICTPIYLNTSIVGSLIESFLGPREFAKWFNSIPGKSEFILYYLWAQTKGVFDTCHYKTEDWAGPYLRDSDTFDGDFEEFINFVGVHEPHKWVSINHRSWGDMSDKQYKNTTDKLAEYNLAPNFTEYRTHYLERYR
jgi:hypothetical protein